MSTITQRKKDAYLDKPFKCMHCGSYEMEYTNVDVGDGSAGRDVKCRECGACWLEMYKLIDVEEI
jgi:transcription elongation factor Elf1